MGSCDPGTERMWGDCNQMNYPAPKAGESFYVEYDEDTCCWGVFGDESGHCYDLVSSREEAQDCLACREGSDNV